MPGGPVNDPEHRPTRSELSTMTLLDSLRKPEYTGENRCIPCTTVNLVIAGVGGLLLALLSLPLAAGFVALALGSIWLRGYLVPGTPELTKRYFPDWLLARFDKLPRAQFDARTFDTEAFLAEAGVVVEDESLGDIALAPDFEAAWTERMADLGDGDTDKAELASLIGHDPDEFDISYFGDAFVASVGPEWIGQWESRAAFVADMAAARELAARTPDWGDMPLSLRSRVLGGLRLFLEQCPTCDGTVSMAPDVVKSCCRSYDVIAVRCEDCGARLLEADYDPASLYDDADGVEGAGVGTDDAVVA
jgi:hypothetical protein